MKNVKIKVENEDQNLKVQERLCGLNKEASGFAWVVNVLNGDANYYYQVDDGSRAVCSRWKHHKYLVIDNDLDLIICVNEYIWKKRKEKEVSFEEFMENK